MSAGVAAGGSAPTEPSRAASAVRRLALAIGIVLFAATLYVVDLPETAAQVRRLGLALPAALVISGLWHLVRTWAWAWCFPRPRPVSFATLVRVRFAAEAFSYLTIRGVAGEPLKVLLLPRGVDVRDATAAVALERVAYTVGTILIVGAGSLLAIAFVPLTRGWFRVFRAFAIVAGVVAVLSVLAIRGRGTYLSSLMRGIDRRTGLALAAGRVGGFVASVERLMLELVRGSPTRLAVLGAATMLTFLLMVLEAWVIMRAAGAALGFADATAVETFSRVASFASFLIPANLGALEASSVAAAAAVGTTGGAALAVARRIRGLFWAGIGLAIYPRRAKPSKPAAAAERIRGNRPPHSLLYLPDAPDVTIPPFTHVAGLPMAERVLRSASRAGCSRVLIWWPDAPIDRRLQTIAGRVSSGDVAIVTTPDEWRAAICSDLPCTIVGPGVLPSPGLLEDGLSILPSGVEPVDVPAGPRWPVSGVLRVMGAGATDVRALEEHLRTMRARPVALPTGSDVSHGRARLALRITTGQERTRAEAVVRDSVHKSTDGVVASFNRRMSYPISLTLMRTPVTANQISVLLVGIGLYSGWLFSLGHYWTGVLAALLSLAAGVLDGCDGEIARLKYQESELGCWIETIGDYSYYLAIFVGLTAGAARQTGRGAFSVAGGLALAGTVASFALLIYLRRRITSGHPERLAAIARDRFGTESSRFSALLWRLNLVATRAAMPYGLLAFALLNALPAFIVLAAIAANVYWISLTVKMRHLVGEEGRVRIVDC